MHVHDYSISLSVKEGEKKNWEKVVSTEKSGYARTSIIIQLTILIRITIG